MSYVTGIVIWTGTEDYTEPEDGPDAVHWIEVCNKWLSDNYRRDAALVQVDGTLACGKHPQVTVAGGGYDYFPAAEFAKFFQTLRWKNPEDVVMIVKTENEETRIYNTTGRLSNAP